MNLQQLHKWHQTKLGLLLFGLVELLATYLLVLRALDTGSLLEYALALIFLIGALQNLIKLFMPRGRHGK